MAPQKFPSPSEADLYTHLTQGVFWGSDVNVYARWHKSCAIVIPGLTRNPVFSWIPAYAGMTCSVVINESVHKKSWISHIEQGFAELWNVDFDILRSKELLLNPNGYIAAVSSVCNAQPQREREPNVKILPAFVHGSGDFRQFCASISLNGKISSLYRPNGTG